MHLTTSTVNVIIRSFIVRPTCEGESGTKILFKQPLKFLVLSVHNLVFKENEVMEKTPSLIGKKREGIIKEGKRKIQNLDKHA